MLLPVPQAAARAQGDWRRVAAGITTRSNHSMHAGLRQDKSSAHVPAFGCSDVPGRLEGGGGVSSQAHAWRSCEQRSCLTQVCINHLTFRLLEPRRAVHCHCRCALPRAGSTRTVRSTSRLTAWWQLAPRAHDALSTIPATSARPGPRRARLRSQRSARLTRTRTSTAAASYRTVMWRPLPSIGRHGGAVVCFHPARAHHTVAMQLYQSGLAGERVRAAFR